MNQNVYKKQCGSGHPKLTVFGTPTMIVLGPCLAPGGLQMAAWRPGPGPRGRGNLTTVLCFQWLDPTIKGEPGAQTVAAAAMVFKWAFLVRHQILLHLLPKLLRVRLRCALRSDTFGLRFGLRFALRLGVRFVVQFDGFVSDVVTDVICDIQNQQVI